MITKTTIIYHMLLSIHSFYIYYSFSSCGVTCGVDGSWIISLQDLQQFTALDITSAKVHFHHTYAKQKRFSVILTKFEI